MSSEAPKELKHSVVTKSFLLFNIIGVILVSFLDLKYAFNLAFDPFIYNWQQYYRLFTNQLIFLNESQVLFSSIILYNYRILERSLSSHQYVSFLVIVYIVNIVLQIIGNFLFKLLLPDSLNFLQSFNYAPGPLPAIGALTYQYSIFIPVTYKFELTDILPKVDGKIHKTVFSDKVFVYILCLQLAFGEGFNTFLPMFNGYLIAFLINSGILPVKQWRLPFFKEVYRFLYKKSIPRSQPLRRPLMDNQRQDTPESDGEPPRPLATQLLDSVRR